MKDVQARRSLGLPHEIDLHANPPKSSINSFFRAAVTGDDGNETIKSSNESFFNTASITQKNQDDGVSHADNTPVKAIELTVPAVKAPTKAGIMSKASQMNKSHGTSIQRLKSRTENLLERTNSFPTSTRSHASSASAMRERELVYELRDDPSSLKVKQHSPSRDKTGDIVYVAKGEIYDISGSVMPPLDKVNSQETNAQELHRKLKHILRAARSLTEEIRGNNVRIFPVNCVQGRSSMRDVYRTIDEGIDRSIVSQLNPQAGHKV